MLKPRLTLMQHALHKLSIQAKLQLPCTLKNLPKIVPTVKQEKNSGC